LSRRRPTLKRIIGVDTNDELTDAERESLEHDAINSDFRLQSPSVKSASHPKGNTHSYHIDAST